ncbi:hypothetical protein DR864_09330 [Runella rosea]|uniref:Lipoprotein n=1 Tax=Runella rosea TaxID=2259595 RepID=A0A344TGZ9_9BACT|nr:hypothetical protein [Runella rosea]AXE17920.1 hypothetical protein DR864_09330 [Runella rosea]
MKIFYLIVYLLFLSCNNQSKELIKVNTTFKEVSPKENFDGFSLVIPIDGCGPCVEKGISFSKKNLKNPKILFFISSQLNLKPIYQYYTEGELSTKSLLLDKSSLFFKNGLINQGHLLLLEIHQGHVDKMTDIEPNEVDDILSKLEKSINN